MVCNGARQAGFTWLLHFCMPRPLIPSVRPSLSKQGRRNVRQAESGG